MPFDTPYRGELVGTKIKIIAPTPFYSSADDSNGEIGFLREGTFMIMAYLDSDPAKTTQPIFLVIADPTKKFYIIAKDDVGSNYTTVKGFPWLWVLLGIGFFFAFAKKRRVSHG